MAVELTHLQAHLLSEHGVDARLLDPMAARGRHDLLHAEEAGHGSGALHWDVRKIQQTVQTTHPEGDR